MSVASDFVILVYVIRCVFGQYWLIVFIGVNGIKQIFYVFYPKIILIMIIAILMFFFIIETFYQVYALSLCVFVNLFLFLQFVQLFSDKMSFFFVNILPNLDAITLTLFILACNSLSVSCISCNYLLKCFFLISTMYK